MRRNVKQEEKNGAFTDFTEAEDLLRQPSVYVHYSINMKMKAVDFLNKEKQKKAALNEGKSTLNLF